MSEHKDTSKLAIRRVTPLVAISYVGNCNYLFIWKDGYRCTYNAAVQCGYKEPDNAANAVTIVDGYKVKFPDGSIISAELLRVEAIQSFHHSSILVVGGGLMACAFILIALYFNIIRAEMLPPVYACLGVLSAVSTLPMYVGKHFLFKYIGACITAAGVALCGVHLLLGAVLLGLGLSWQILYMVVLNHRTAAGLNS